MCVCERERVRETSALFFRFSISMLRRSSSYLAEMARSTCTRSESRPIWCCVSVSACACVYEWMRVLKYQLAHVGGGGEGVDGSVVLLVRPLVCVCVCVCVCPRAWLRMLLASERGSWGLAVIKWTWFVGSLSLLAEGPACRWCGGKR